MGTLEEEARQMPAPAYVFLNLDRMRKPSDQTSKRTPASADPLQDLDGMRKPSDPTQESLDGKPPRFLPL
ncbi:hypothetical protein Nepgr_029110 [Nepenthes gracilis]|uniref:Uncharacterized protein n=1 Tax=Nepenthes gracilis TaxID=150966 RepID=A0AAD3Y2Q1_NEPGR|nr:hypothetical protein Nepgr_029110 [Nepenthes gracilis]